MLPPSEVSLALREENCVWVSMWDAVWSRGTRAETRS